MPPSKANYKVIYPERKPKHVKLDDQEAESKSQDDGAVLPERIEIGIHSIVASGRIEPKIDD